jgi:hypothetical protein
MCIDLGFWTQEETRERTPAGHECFCTYLGYWLKLAFALNDTRAGSCIKGINEAPCRRCGGGGKPTASKRVGKMSISSTSADETVPGFGWREGGSEMIRGMRVPSSKFVNFPHSPCSPSCQPWLFVSHARSPSRKCATQMRHAKPSRKRTRQADAGKTAQMRERQRERDRGPTHSPHSRTTVLLRSSSASRASSSFPICASTNVTEA